MEAAKRGNMLAATNLGVLYENGSGTDRNYGEAFRLYDQAAAAGQPLAMIYLGNMYRDGRGVNRDYTMARDWYAKAVQKDSMLGLWRLVVLVDQNGVDPNRIELAGEALKAARGDSDAREELFAGKFSRELRSAIQSELETTGFYSGRIDGRFGREFRDALVKYFTAPAPQEQPTANLNSAPQAAPIETK
jgi:TPR repeat protein